jgi:hypothetical protein
MPAASWPSGATTTTTSGRIPRWATRPRQKRAGRLSNPRAPRPPRLPHPKPTTINPKDSRHERGTTGGQVKCICACDIGRARHEAHLLKHRTIILVAVYTVALFKRRRGPDTRRPTCAAPFSTRSRKTTPTSTPHGRASSDTRSRTCRRPRTTCHSCSTPSQCASAPPAAPTPGGRQESTRTKGAMRLWNAAT